MAKAVQGHMKENSTKHTRWNWEQQTETDFQSQRHHFGGYSRAGNSRKRKLISTILQHDYSYDICGVFFEKRMLYMLARAATYGKVL